MQRMYLRYRPSKSIDEVVKEARKMGMSYGNAVAWDFSEQKRIQAEKEEKRRRGSREYLEAHKAEFAKKLIQAREKRNLTQRKLASMIGVGPLAVDKWESAKTVPIDLLLEKLYEVFGDEIRF